jgi:asparagine synthase (glutamine-hydrolysing)
MCGVVGFLDFDHRFSAAEQVATCRRMTDTLAHRGPDDHGTWCDAAAGVALGHRRLSILDLSASGHQPMTSASGRYVLTYNGELYNFEQLRHDLQDYPYRGHSDTEVILAAVERWGLGPSLPRFDGMFALGLWDNQARTLHLARDRFGEKPIYYGVVDGAVLFASELKAFYKFQNFHPSIDRGSVAQLLRYGYVPAPRSIYAGIRKLPPASSIAISSAADAIGNAVPYWSYEESARSARARRFVGSDADAVDELDARLRTVISSRCVSDVPIGAFLSGGIDSSAIVALLQESTGKTARTFTIGFNEIAFNEAASAKRVAQHLGSNHTELYVSPAEALEVIPRLPVLYDEPFADASQIPTFLVSQLARQHVTVALTGDAGDELFGGYNRYKWAEAIWGPLSHLPYPARAWLAAAIRMSRPAALDSAFRRLDGTFAERFAIRNPGDKMQKAGELLRARDTSELYFHLVSTWKATDVVIGAVEPRHPVLQDQPPQFDNFTERMMCADAVTYLPDDILVKVDRAAMAVSLETRVPLLSPNIASFAWSLPRSMKFRDGKGKWILREVLARYVPRELFDRPKMGFGVPIDSWLRGPLRAWAEALLAEDRLLREGYFHPGPIRKKWTEHLSGRRNWQYPLWHVLMFQSWLEAQALR